MSVLRRYIIVRRVGRPPQVLHMLGTYQQCWELVADLWQHGDAHSLSICAEESRHGADPAGTREYMEI